MNVLDLVARAEAALALRRWAEAERHARAALATEPGDEASYSILALALGAQGRSTEALAAAADGLTASPHSVRLHLAHSAVLNFAGRHGEALLAAEETLRLAPDIGAGHHYRSMALVGLGRLLEARSAAERAIELSPEEPNFISQLADAWLDEDPKQAEHHYRESLAIDPARPMVLNNLGVALLRQRRRAEAALAFKSAILLDPTLSLAKGNAFVASNPARLAPVQLWIALGLSVAGIGFSIYAGSRGSPPAFAGALACLAAQLAVSVRGGRIGLRRLAELDPQLHAIRLKLEADIRTRRLDLAPVLRRRIGVAIIAFGTATLLGTLTAGLFVVRKHLAFPETPRVLTLENARPDEWVRLEGATLDCASRLEVGSNLYARTYFAGHSSGGRDFVAAYDKGVTCVVARSQLEGVVSDLNPHLRETLTKNGLPLALGPVAKLCTECGPRQTRLGIVILLVGAALGAFLVWAGVAEYRGRVSGR